MKLSTLFAVLLLCLPVVDRAEDVSFARELVFNDIFATKQNDSRIYMIMGGGFLLTISSGNTSQFIKKWLSRHPAATVTSISRMFSTNTKTKSTSEYVFIWVEDGEASLNIDLIRAGMWPGGVMIDMVDRRERLDELLKAPELADTRAEVERERAELPLDREERLISEDDYRQRMGEIETAEEAARREKLGIWSDSMKDEREAEGYP